MQVNFKPINEYSDLIYTDFGHYPEASEIYGDQFSIGSKKVDQLCDDFSLDDSLLDLDTLG